MMRVHSLVADRLSADGSAVPFFVGSWPGSGSHVLIHRRVCVSLFLPLCVLVHVLLTFRVRRVW